MVTTYRVYAQPLPDSKDAETIARYEGYFFCLSNRPDPKRLLSELLLRENAEVILMEQEAIGEIEYTLGTASHRAIVDEKGCSWAWGKTVRFSELPKC